MPDFILWLTHVAFFSSDLIGSDMSFSELKCIWSDLDLSVSLDSVAWKRVNMLETGQAGLHSRVRNFCHELKRNTVWYIFFRIDLHVKYSLNPFKINVGFPGCSAPCVQWRRCGALLLCCSVGARSGEEKKRNMYKVREETLEAPSLINHYCFNYYSLQWCWDEASCLVFRKAALKAPVFWAPAHEEAKWRTFNLTFSFFEVYSFIWVHI